MQPSVGSISDPQAIFKIFRTTRLRCALRRLGFDKNRVRLNEIQDGSLACEPELLATLTEDGCVPNIREYPAIETMAYPADVSRMLILTSANIKAMKRAAQRSRQAVRERPLLGEGTESLVIRQPEGGVMKIPRCPERLALYPSLPSSRVTDNRCLDAALALPGAFRTFVMNRACRHHRGRGFAVNPVVFDLMEDRRPEVAACLVPGMQVAVIHHAVRLPCASAMILAVARWLDRLLLRRGVLLECVGMLPTIIIRPIAFGARVVRLMIRTFNAIWRPLVSAFRRSLSLLLCGWDRLRSWASILGRHAVAWLEIAGLLRVFALLDCLDQRSGFWHRFLQSIARIYVECTWLFDGLNMSVHFGRPILCVVQPAAVKPVWAVICGLPRMMTGEIKYLLGTSLSFYQKLADLGYYDGELSLNDMGFCVKGPQIIVVLLDHGALVNGRRVQACFLRPWLQNVQRDFLASYEVYRLRSYAQGNSRAEQIVETYIRDMREVIEGWMRRF